MFRRIIKIVAISLLLSSSAFAHADWGDRHHRHGHHRHGHHHHRHDRHGFDSYRMPYGPPAMGYFPTPMHYYVQPPPPRYYRHEPQMPRHEYHHWDRW